MTTKSYHKYIIVIAKYTIDFLSKHYPADFLYHCPGIFRDPRAV